MSASSLSNDSKVLCKLIDAINRGNRVEVPQATNVAREVYLQSTTAMRDDSLADKQRAEMLSTAVNLHNRVKAVTASAKADKMKAYLNATVGNYLMIYCNPASTIKASTKSIALLSRAGMDLSSDQGVSTSSPEMMDDGIACLQRVVSIWASIPEGTMASVVARHEMEVLQSILWEVHMALAELLSRRGSGDVVGHIQKANEHCHKLPITTQFEFAKRATSVALFISSTDSLESFTTAVSILRQALAVIETSTPEWRRTETEASAALQKCIVLSVLLRLYQELNQIENGQSIIRQADAFFIEHETSTGTGATLLQYREQYLYYKLKLQLKAGQLDDAEACLRRLLSLCSSYDLAFKSVRLLVASPLIGLVDEGFTILLQRFPADPQRSSTRCAYIESLIAMSSTTPCDESGQQRLLQLCGTVISDHNSGAHVLTKELSERLKKVVQGQVRSFMAQESYSFASDWLVILEDTVRLSGHDELLSAVLIQKTDVLLRLGRAHDAFTAALALAEREDSTRAVTTLFKTSLLSGGGARAESALLTAIERHKNVLENLERIEFCTDIAQAAGEHQVAEHLCHLWIATYERQEAWELHSSGEEATTLGAMLCYLANLSCNKYGLFTTKKRPLSELYQTEERIASALASKTSLDAIQEGFAAPVQVLMRVYSAADKRKQEVLGTEAQFKWLSEVLWNVGVFLVGECTDASADNRYLAAASFFEMSAELFERFVYSDNHDVHHIFLSLIVASALRLDADTIATKDAAEVVVKGSLDRAMEDMAKVDHYLGLSDAEDKPSLFRLALVVGFNVLLRGDTAAADAFLKDRQHNLLSLSVEELVEFAGVCSHESNGTSTQVITLLNLALQKCSRESYSDYTVMSRIYVELIKMSRSREEALHKIVEFEQLFFNYRATHPDDAASFPTDAIDSVCRAAYNNGLTLYDLGQHESSLNFLSKAVALLPHTSDHMAIWKDNIQDVFRQAQQQQQQPRHDAFPEVGTSTFEQRSVRASAVPAEVTAEGILALI